MCQIDGISTGKLHDFQPGEGAGRPDTAKRLAPTPFETWSAGMFTGSVLAAQGRPVRSFSEDEIRSEFTSWLEEWVHESGHFGTPPAPPASPADDVPDADAVAFQNGYRIGVRVGSEHHGPCRGLPPASPVPPTPAPQADRDKLEIDVEELLIDHCGMGGTSALTDRILALTDAFTFAAAPPSTPAERAPAAIVDDGEVILAAEGDGYVLTVQINEAGDAVSHRLTADEVRTLLAVTPTRPGADAVIRALIAACPSYGRGEGDTFRIEESAVVRLAREFLAAAPPTPTPCPYIVTGGEGTSHCSLAERSAMHAAAPPSTPADPRPTDLTGSEA